MLGRWFGKNPIYGNASTMITNSRFKSNFYWVIGTVLTLSVCAATYLAPAVTKLTQSIKYKIFTKTAPNLLWREHTRFLTLSSFRNLNPLTVTDAEGQKITQLLYRGLVATNQNLVIQNDLALQTITSKDYKQFKFILDPTAKFRDGTPITAHAVLQTFETYKKESPHWVVFAAISKFEAPDDQTFIIHTNTPQPFFLKELPIIRIFKLATDGTFMESGEYELRSFTEDRLTIERSRYARNATIKKITFIYTADDMTRTQMLLKGDADMTMDSLSSHLFDRISRDGPHLKLTTAPGVKYSYLCFQFRNQYLSDLRVRQAIAHAIDRKEIVEKRLKNLSYLSTSILAPVHTEFYIPLRDPASRSYNVELANELLDQAGYPRNASGKRFSLRYLTTNDRTGHDIAEIIANELDKIGIEVTLETVDSATFFDRVLKRDFDLFTSRWIGVNGPQILAKILHSSQTQKNNPKGTNRGEYHNPKLDQLIDQFLVETDTAKQKHFVTQAQEILQDDLPYLDLWHWNTSLFAPNDAQNIILYPNGSYETLIYLK